MKIDNEFTVSAPIQTAWDVLTDLEGIAPCLPGAVLTGRDGDAYTGKVKIKVGPITSEYAGVASFVEKDDATHHAVIDAKGKDSRGAGNANALITADLTAQGDRTLVSVSTDLKITGKIAQFGSGMIQEVSKKLLGQFVACLETKLTGPADQSPADQSPADQSTTDESTTTMAPTEEPTPAPPPASGGAPTAEPDALDMLALSRGALAKRLVPLIAGVAVVALIIYLVAR
jgi:carbon monoxide dehydrogenase subunit G